MKYFGSPVEKTHGWKNVQRGNGVKESLNESGFLNSSAFLEYEIKGHFLKKIFEAIKDFQSQYFILSEYSESFHYSFKLDPPFYFSLCQNKRN